MRIGIPKEIKNNEFRVGITPAGAELLIQHGHQVVVERHAGISSGFADNEYKACGVRLADSASEVWQSDMVIKVKEPLDEEYVFFREGLILFTYLHLAANEKLTRALAEKKVTAVSYETVQLANGSLPLLVPMSEVAGRMTVQIGASLLEKRNGGKGILLGGVPGVPAAKVVVIGGGVVGTQAARMAIGMGARTTIIDNDAVRLRQLDDLFQGRLETRMSNPFTIHQAVKDADLLIGAVLVPGFKAPRIVKEETVRQMKPGSVIVDAAIDQGGSIETIDRITTHSDPTYVKHGVVHYSVANMPGAVPYTSTVALTNVTMPYALRIANEGLERLLEESRDSDLMKGINVLNGNVVHAGIAEAANLPYKPLGEAG